MALHIDDFAGKRVHMIGIGGSSMSGLAGLLFDRGYQITGSDNYASYLLEAVRAHGIPVTLGHAAENVHGAALVVYSAAIGEQNPERREAVQLGIPQMERATLLGQLMQGYKQAIGVAGTHGKTTTTAMLAQALTEAGLNPAVHLGGSFDFIGGSTRIGKHDVFAAEACEFHNSFLEMKPTVGIVLNIDADHLDFFGTIENIQTAFGQFVSNITMDGTFAGNGDDPRVRVLLQNAACATLSFGFSEENDLRAMNVQYNELGHPFFDVALHGDIIAGVSLRVGGKFNVINALAALAGAYVVGADLTRAAEALSNFKGVHRRLEHTGTVQGVKLYHDYGHNPTEMQGALSVMKMQPHNRLWAVMQPHTYSRVKRLFDEYIHCCDDADEILITDIYAAREVDPGDIHSSMLVNAIKKTGQRVHLTPTFADTEKYLREHWQPGDLVLTMGCGNINELNDLIAGHGE